jgi:glycosyltransferase involved in cell wall biosynthesis
METITVLYDGWPLVYKPNSAAALHLSTLLHYQPEGVRSVVALPGQPAFPLPEHAGTHTQPTSESESARLEWEQRSLPRLSRELAADLLHFTTGHPAMFRAVPSVASPADFSLDVYFQTPGSRGSRLAARLREALGQGARTRAYHLFWPADMPSPEGKSEVVQLPPVVNPAFSPGESEFEERAGIPEDLPGTYLIYHGPSTLPSLRRMLDAWSWAAGTLGDYYPLLVLGLDATGRAALEHLLPEYQPGETIRSLPVIPPAALAAIYRGCSAVFHPAPLTPWEGPLRLALACGKPAVSIEGRLADALAGPAAYLIPPGPDSNRALGAALISIVVDENLSSTLSEAARQRSAGWQNPQFSDNLLAAYRSILAQP